MENEKKIILVNGNGSRWYEQAIFIINKNETSVPKNIVSEAEKIINEHLNKKYNNTYNSHSKTNVSRKKINKSLNLCLNLFIFCTISIIICLAYFILY